MPTQEERIAALERKVAAIELQRLYDERKAAENTPSEQAYNYSEINHNLTMLLGIASGQEHAIRLMQGDLNVVKDDLGIVKADLGIVKERVEEQERDIRVMKADLGIVKERVEQIVQLLTTLTTKLE